MAARELVVERREEKKNVFSSLLPTVDSRAATLSYSLKKRTPDCRLHVNEKFVLARKIRHFTSHWA